MFERQYELGTNYLNQGSLEKAIESFSRAIQIDHEEVCLAYIARGFAYETKGDTVRALADYSHVIEVGGLVSSIATAHLNRGIIYTGLKKFDKALEDYSWLIDEHKRSTSRSTHPDFDLTPVYNNRALLYLATGEYGKALADISIVCDLDSGDPESFFVRAQAYMGLNQIADAIEALNNAIKLNSHDAKFYGFRHELHLAHNNINGAISDIENYLKLNGGRVYNNQQKMEERLRQLKELANARVKDQASNYKIFCLFYRKGDQFFLKPKPHAYIIRATYGDGQIQIHYNGEALILEELNILLVQPGNWEQFSDKTDTNQISVNHES